MDHPKDLALKLKYKPDINSCDLFNDYNLFSMTDPRELDEARRYQYIMTPGTIQIRELWLPCVGDIPCGFKHLHLQKQVYKPIKDWKIYQDDIERVRTLLSKK